MGSISAFSCSSCGYATQVSGGPDRGMNSKTTTVVCLDGRELMDVITFEIFAGPEDQDARRKARCEVDPKHKVKRWRDGGPCPRCGTRLVNTGPVALWD